jgi:hypothetical protein
MRGHATEREQVDRLVKEIRDLLDVSSVGLYEFMEFLNDPYRPMPVTIGSVAPRTLERLVRDKGVELHRLGWEMLQHGFVPWPGSPQERARHFADTASKQTMVTRPGQLCWFDTGPQAARRPDPG